ncbi:MAG TPA: cob(I)yrinic acid a,c-diamide adenosyltransferase, partial [candidate division WOR-3 bacterium]|nr:cob(I)yrinic acid a,c-diamide adenosyltransferase [candidate division WOR-3 bacterium]
YTGDGKGKTTAAFGLALRATGHGWPVLIIQFMKGDPSYGEVIAARGVEHLEVVQTGLPTFVEKGNPSAEDLSEAGRGLELARAALSGGRYRMVILDELNVAVEYGLVSLKDALALADMCPKEVELVFTGRHARPEVIARADLVSEVREVNHPMRKGIVSRAGVDY